MAFVPLPEDTVIDLQNRIQDLWNRIVKERKYSSVAEFLILFKKGLITEFHIEGPQAYWFTIGLLAGGMHDRQLLKVEIDALIERVYPEEKKVP